VSFYSPRLIDIELDELRDLPAISLEGPKAVGKTETAARRAVTTFDLDNPELLAIIEADPKRLVSTGEPPVFIDEWQRYPPSWDLVRRQVDADRSARFLLAGSAAPVEAPLHSGAGRIVTVRMRPMSLAERGLGVSTVRLSDLLDGHECELGGSTELDGIYQHIKRVAGFYYTISFDVRSRGADFASDDESVILGMLLCLSLVR